MLRRVALEAGDDLENHHC